LRAASRSAAVTSAAVDGTPHRGQGGLPQQRHAVGRAVAVEPGGHLVQVDIRAQWDRFPSGAQDFTARRGIGRFDEHQPFSRPGRSSAGSIRSGRLVAPSTTTSRSGSMPVELGQQRGHHTIGHARVEALAAPRRQRVHFVEEHQRRGGIAGPPKSSRTAFSEDPTHLSISSEPLTVCTLSCPVLASARTTNVLPQPGGP